MTDKREKGSESSFPRGYESTLWRKARLPHHSMLEIIMSLYAHSLLPSKHEDLNHRDLTFYYIVLSHRNNRTIKVG
jgi:hypothetical protein